MSPKKITSMVDTGCRHPPVKMKKNVEKRERKLQKKKSRSD